MKSEHRINYRYFDLLGMIVSGLFIGYFRQHVADSGQSYPDEILKSMGIGVGAYLLAFIILIKHKIAWRVPSWIIHAVAGSAVCSFSLHVVEYAVVNWVYRKSESVVSYIRWLLPDMVGAFIFATAFYSVIALCVVGTIRFLVGGTNALRGA